MFTGENIPVHPHVYSNGHICLSILTEDWSPALQSSQFVLALLACFPAAKKKGRTFQKYSGNSSSFSSARETFNIKFI